MASPEHAEALQPREWSELATDLSKAALESLGLYDASEDVYDNPDEAPNYWLSAN